MHANRTRRTLSARFVDRTTDEERVVTVRVAAMATADQLEAYLSEAYPFPMYVRLDREPTMPLFATAG